MAKTTLNAGTKEHVEFPEGTACKIYEKHKEEYGDYNLLGQVYKLECQITKTNFDDTESIERLKRVAKDVGETIIDLVGD